METKSGSKLNWALFRFSILGGGTLTYVSLAGLVAWQVHQGHYGLAVWGAFVELYLLLSMYFYISGGTDEKLRKILDRD